MKNQTNRYNLTVEITDKEYKKMKYNTLIHLSLSVGFIFFGYISIYFVNNVLYTLGLVEILTIWMLVASASLGCLVYLIKDIVENWNNKSDNDFDRIIAYNLRKEELSKGKLDYYNKAFKVKKL